jgi:hypothetical protein
LMRARGASNRRWRGAPTTDASAGRQQRRERQQPDARAGRQQPTLARGANNLLLLRSLRSATTPAGGGVRGVSPRQPGCDPLRAEGRENREKCWSASSARGARKQPPSLALASLSDLAGRRGGSGGLPPTKWISVCVVTRFTRRRSRKPGKVWERLTVIRPGTKREGGEVARNRGVNSVRGTARSLLRRDTEHGRASVLPVDLIPGDERPSRETDAEGSRRLGGRIHAGSRHRVVHRDGVAVGARDVGSPEGLWRVGHVGLEPSRREIGIRTSTPVGGSG